MIPDAEFVARVKALVAEYDAPPPPPPGPPTISLTAGQDLQTALDTAPEGATIALEAGATWYGRYVARLPVRLTTAGEFGPGRIAADAPVAWLRSPGNEPAIAVPQYVYGVQLSCVGIAGNDLPGTALRVGSGESPEWSDQPAVASLDRLLIRVADDQQLQRGIAWHGGRGGSIRGCRVEGVKKLGQETQALWISNCHGDLTVEDNLLEGASIGLLIGGAPQYMTGGIPTGIRILNNDFPKRTEWRALNYVCKNAIELKCGVDVDLLGNRGSGVVNGENQGGYWLVLTTKDNGHRSPWIKIQHVRVRDNVFTDCAAGIKLSAVYSERQDDNSWLLIPSEGASDIEIANNLTVANFTVGVESGRRPGHAFLNYLQGPIPGLSVVGNTLLGNHPTWWYCEGAANERAAFRGNVGLHNTYGLSGNGTTGNGLSTLARYFPGAAWEQNAMIGAPILRYPTETWRPTWAEFEAACVDYPGGNYQIRAESGFSGLGWSGQ